MFFDYNNLSFITPYFVLKNDRLYIETDFNGILKHLKGERQIDVIVEMKVPVGSEGGSYSASYGVNSEIETEI